MEGAGEYLSGLKATYPLVALRNYLDANKILKVHCVKVNLSGDILTKGGETVRKIAINYGKVREFIPHSATPSGLRDFFISR